MTGKILRHSLYHPQRNAYLRQSGTGPIGSENVQLERMDQLMVQHMPEALSRPGIGKIDPSLQKLRDSTCPFSDPAFGDIGSLEFRVRPVEDDWNPGEELMVQPRRKVAINRLSEP